MTNLPDIKDKNILFVTGSGLSVASGIRTFYSEDGMYSSQPDSEGHSVIDCISDTMLINRPEKTWATLFNLYKEFSVAKANDAHKNIQAIANINTGITNIITMNIDGFHGHTANVNEVHGNINISTCSQCEREHHDHFKQMQEGAMVPVCQDCGGILHPDVVLFEQMPKLNAHIFSEQYDIIMMIGVGAPQHYIMKMIAKKVLNWGTELHFVNPYQTFDEVISGNTYIRESLENICIYHKTTAVEFTTALTKKLVE